LVLFPPICEECRQRSPNGVFEQTPSILYVHYNSPSQAHFELVGNSPFKSNSFTAIDFNTGYIAIADHALTDSHGKHTTCFVMPLDRSAMPSMSALQDALRIIVVEVQSEFGWQEYWQYQVEPIDALSAEHGAIKRIVIGEGRIDGWRIGDGNDKWRKSTLNSLHDNIALCWLTSSP
uniref:BRICHOS domain-containing protein n=1 Tax=Parascaris equorum TaxID=6256 RepID=A0A914RY60_PAREQ